MKKALPINQDEMGRAMAQNFLGAFCKFMDKDFQVPSHINTLIQALQKVEKGEIKRLLVTMPPRAGKSQIASRLFPAWYLGRNPNKNIIFTTYGQDFADDFGRQVRNYIANDKYSAVFPEVKLSSDSASVKKFSLNSGGGYFAVGAGGAITGRGADCIAEGELITTNKGYIRIENIVEDPYSYRILTLNHKLNKYEYSNIVAAVHKGQKRVVTIYTAGNMSTKLTEDHLVWVQGRGYTPAAKLYQSDRVVIDSGFPSQQSRHANSKNVRCDTVHSVTSPSERLYDIYDIQVEDNQNFFSSGILVHNCAIIDDPHKNRQEASSEVIRHGIIDWFNSTLYTRLSNTGTLILIQTRWHREDLAGYLLSKEPDKWHHINFPAISDDNKALWPERWPLEKLEEIRKTIGTFEFESLYQQNPVPRSGNIIKKEWIQTYRELPEVKSFSWSWDTAIKAGQENDYSVGQLWAECNNGYYLVDLFRERLDYPELRKMVYALYNKHKSHEVLIEDKASGQQILQDFKRIGTMPVVAMIPGRDMAASKTERMDLVSPLFEAGKVFLPQEATYLYDVIDELTNFPYTKHDDICDSMTQYLARRLGKLNKNPKIRML